MVDSVSLIGAASVGVVRDVLRAEISTAIDSASAWSRRTPPESQPASFRWHAASWRAPIVRSVGRSTRHRSNANGHRG